MQQVNKNFYRNKLKLIFTILNILILFSLSLQCEDSCSACQETVYRLKFQGSADCKNPSNCRDTCYKIKESWNSPLNMFEFFKNDIFGKCEICFRAGYCSISQCENQKLNELQVINSVINSNKLSANVDNLSIDIDQLEIKNQKSLQNFKNQNEKIISLIKKSLTKSLENKSTKKFLENMKELYHSYFDSPFDMPKDTKEIFEKLKSETKVNLNEIDNEDVIKGYTVLSNLEDRITELEGIANEYINDKNSKKLNPKIKKEVLELVNNFKRDFKKYQSIFHKNLS